MQDAVLMPNAATAIKNSMSSVFGIAFAKEEGPAAVMRAMRQFQNEMTGQAEKVGLKSEDEVVKWIMESRRV